MGTKFTNSIQLFGHKFLLFALQIEWDEFDKIGRKLNLQRWKEQKKPKLFYKQSFGVLFADSFSHKMMLLEERLFNDTKKTKMRSNPIPSIFTLVCYLLLLQIR
jgi:hypothetical protein